MGATWGAGGVSTGLPWIDSILWVQENELTKGHFMNSLIKRTLDKILPQKNAAPPADAPSQKKSPGPDPKAATVILAWRSPQKNTRLLTAYLPGTDPNNPNNLVSVNVRANHNFLPGMKLTAMQVSATVYDLVGPLPRWRGRM